MRTGGNQDFLAWATLVLVIRPDQLHAGQLTLRVGSQL